MNKQITLKDYASPLGMLSIGAVGGRICMLMWHSGKGTGKAKHRLEKILGAETIYGTSAALEAAELQLDEYFAGKRREINLPLSLSGTGFQQAVWEELKKIPYGETASYADIATRLGRPEAVRAVAAAIGANPVTIVIPCHRVIGSNGALTGYVGGTDIKQALLTLEKEAHAGT